MCSPARCRQCGKVTWSGCGTHVASIKAMVPPDQWCGGHGSSTAPRSGGFFGGFGR